MQNYRLSIDLQCFAQEKTEKATPKKRQEARRKGQVAKSMEVPGAFILFFTFLFLFMFGGFFKDRLFSLFTISLHEYILWDLTDNTVAVIFSSLMIEILLFLMPFFIMTVVVGILANYIQIGFLVATDPLMMKLNKLNPIEGAKRIFALRALVEFAKTIFKLFIIAITVFLTLWLHRMEIISLANRSVEQILIFVGNLTLMIGLMIGVILIILSLFDYMYQKYDFEKQQRMSKQDIKDEFKKSEGDPLIKGKIREKQRRMAMHRMMQEIPNADVVITNPTHFAVAISYDVDTMEAPLVIAKGQDYVALKIKEKAKEHSIITMENKPLAQALYHQVDIGESIPQDLFQAVAEVLAYVYKVKRKV